MEKNRFSLNKISINSAAIAENYKRIKQSIGNKVICAANIKSDAYGMGLMNIMHPLSKAGCNKFFVSTIDEALELRDFSLTDEIYVLNGISPGEEDSFAQNNIIPVLNTKEQFELYNNYCRKKNRSFAAVLNIDTGINIIGFPYKEALELVKQGYFKQKITISFIMSYFASNSQSNNPYNKNQLQIMKQIQQAFELPVSFAGSTGIMLSNDYHFDIVRPGLLLFGYSNNLKIKLLNAITLTSKIIQIREIQEDFISDYEESYKLNKSSIVATIPIGYGDGLLPALSNKGIFDINGYPAPIVGKISMDLTMIDVTKIPKDFLHIGAEVELLGPNSTIQRMAKHANTTYNNIITSLSSRIHRIYR